MAEILPEYLTKIEAGLAKTDCASKSRDVMAEIRAHLEEATEELIERGMGREAAEQASIERFGTAEAVCRWYCEANPRPTMLRAAVGPLVVLGLFMVLHPYVFSISSPSIGAVRLVFINLFFGLMILACYRARRFTFPVLASALGITAAVFLGAFLLFSVPKPGNHGGYYPVARSAVEQEIRDAKETIAKIDRRIAIFKEGSRVFASTTEPENAEGFVDESGAYLTPMFFEMRDHPELRVYVGDEATDGRFKDWSLARQFWAPQTPAPFEVKEGLAEVSPYVYIRGAVRDRRVAERVLADLPSLARQPWHANVEPFVRSAVFAVLTPAFLALWGDAIGGFLRIAVQFLRRRKMPRIYT